MPETLRETAEAHWHRAAALHARIVITRCSGSLGVAISEGGRTSMYDASPLETIPGPHHSTGGSPARMLCSTHPISLSIPRLP